MGIRAQLIPISETHFTVTSHQAAVLATGAELICPVLLIIGLATRMSSAVLIFLTFMAAISFHLGVTDASTNWNEGYLSHIYFTMLLAVLFFHGAGKVSVDYFICKKFMDGGPVRAQ